MNSLKTRRERLEWPTDKPFKILSLDGGGIRGLYAACILDEIQQDILTDGSLISDYFDMIAGTSTGGIIAIGLGLQKSTSEIRKLYEVDGEKVFPPFWIKHPWLGFLRQCCRPLHDHRVLERLLFETFGEANFGQSVCRLVIPAFKGPRTEIAVFKTDHHPDFRNDWSTYAWEVARATSAAPTYYAGHEGEDYVFLDGGIWANSPIMAALVDVLSAYDVGRDQIEVLSIGTGNRPFEIGRLAAQGGIFRWLKVIEGAMFLTTDNAVAQAGLLLGPDKILRLAPSDEAAGIGLNDWPKALNSLPSEAASAFCERRRDIEKFFEVKCDPRHRFYSSSAKL